MEKTLDDIKFIRAQAKQYEKFVEMLGDLDNHDCKLETKGYCECQSVCKQCGGLGYTIKEREEDGELIQNEEKCECQLKDEDETDKYDL